MTEMEKFLEMVGDTLRPDSEVETQFILLIGLFGTQSDINQATLLLHQCRPKIAVHLALEADKMIKKRFPENQGDEIISGNAAGVAA